MWRKLFLALVIVALGSILGWAMTCEHDHEPGFGLGICAWASVVWGTCIADQKIGRFLICGSMVGALFILHAGKTDTWLAYPKVSVRAACSIYSTRAKMTLLG